jgi:hypothetical protein
MKGVRWLCLDKADLILTPATHRVTTTREKTSTTGPPSGATFQAIEGTGRAATIKAASWAVAARVAAICRRRPVGYG